MDNNLIKVKDRIIQTSELYEKKLLRPLVLFRGNTPEGRMNSLWNWIICNMDVENGSYQEAREYSKENGDFEHLCGLHKTPSISTFRSIISRMAHCKKTTDLIPGLSDYVQLLLDSSPSVFLLSLTQISEYTYEKTRIPWRKKYKRESKDYILKKHNKYALKKISILKYYPYVNNNCSKSEDHKLLLSIDNLIPKSLSNDMRADVCQDMLLAIIKGEASIENIKDDTQYYIKNFFKMYPTKYGPISLDNSIKGYDNIKLVDTIEDPEWDFTENIEF